jgi:hypothetical protein
MIGSGDVAAIALPPGVADSVRAELDYDDGDQMVGARVDLNGDHLDDFIVQSHQRLCGNGGCVFAVVDGRRSAMIGTLFGRPLYVRETSVGGYSTIDALTRTSAEGAELASYAFDGRAYAIRERKSYQGAALEALTAALGRIPRLRVAR